MRSDRPEHEADDVVTRRRVIDRMGNDAGAELVELALPLLLITLVAIVDFGLLFQKQEVVANAAREGVRLAVQPTASVADVTTRVGNYVQASGLSTSPGNPSVVVTNTNLAAAGQTWPAAQVDVFYTHNYTFLSFASYFGGSFSSVTLNTRATMRREAASSP